MASSVLRGLSRNAAATLPAALSASARSLSAPAVVAMPKAEGSGVLAAVFTAAAAAAAATVAASPADNRAICESKSMTMEEFELLALTPLDGRYKSPAKSLRISPCCYHVVSFSSICSFNLGIFFNEKIRAL